MKNEKGLLTPCVDERKAPYDLNEWTNLAFLARYRNPFWKSIMPFEGKKKAQTRHLTLNNERIHLEL
jgi:hypothetical protein